LQISLLHSREELLTVIIHIDQSIKELISILEFYAKKKKYIYEILFCFILCGIIGWIYETAFVLIMFGNITDRGILFISHINDFPIIWGLPFILMYGIGGALMIWCFKPLAKKPILLFFISMISMSIFEFMTSYIYELLHNQILWDYSNRFMNIQGRVCLVTSIIWGVLGVLSVKLLGPLFHRIYIKIKSEKIMHLILIILVIYIFTCYVLRPVLFMNLIDHLQDT